MSNQLEKRANRINQKYIRKKQAFIYKVPVPILPTKKGLIAQSSTVDYIGMLKGGQFIAFDAKMTAVTTRLDLANIKMHQIDFLERINELGGIGFFLVHFYNIHDDKAYLTPLSAITKYSKNPNNRKSIPIDDFKDE